MAKFLLLFHGGTMPESPEEGAKVMQAWTDWFASLGDSVVDLGSPISQRRTFGADGAVSSGDADSVTGYTVLQAADIDAAVALAKTCPGLSSGTRFEVAELAQGM
ncbi:MAG: hypothetical protein OEW24_06500 [Chloroflexota bacterium]|nr:hypothetical protein [Chloroflexota bacterium]